MSERESRRVRGARDRTTVALFSLAAFLFVLALLGAQLGAAGSTGARGRTPVIRRIYETTVIERAPPAGGAPDGTSVTQSVSGSEAASSSSAPLTRAS